MRPGLICADVAHGPLALLPLSTPAAGAHPSGAHPTHGGHHNPAPIICTPAFEVTTGPKTGVLLLLALIQGEPWPCLAAAAHLEHELLQKVAHERERHGEACTQHIKVLGLNQWGRARRVEPPYRPDGQGQTGVNQRMSQAWDSRAPAISVL